MSAMYVVKKIKVPGGVVVRVWFDPETREYTVRDAYASRQCETREEAFQLAEDWVESYLD